MKIFSPEEYLVKEVKFLLTHTKEEVFFLDGSLKMRYFWKKNELDGPQTIFDSNGKKILYRLWENGKKKCEIAWFDNGKMSRRVFYKNGEPHGKACSWYPNGNPYMIQFFRNGKIYGKEKIWDKKGNLEINYYY